MEKLMRIIKLIYNLRFLLIFQRLISGCASTPLGYSQINLGCFDDLTA